MYYTFAFELPAVSAAYLLRLGGSLSQYEPVWDIAGEPGFSGTVTFHSPISLSAVYALFGDDSSIVPHTEEDPAYEM